MPVRFVNLGHRAPEWIDEPTYFITICAKNRGQNQLCTDSAPEILHSIKFYHERGRWYCDLAVLMPDHVHLLLSFGYIDLYSKIIGDWKRWVANRYGVEWQENFFEHRLRAEESLDEKAQYMIFNPVRAGLVKEASDWPHFWQLG